MNKSITSADILFNVRDVFGRNIRTTRSYWKKIKEIKYTELKFGVAAVKKVLIKPDEVRQSVTDRTIFLFAKKVKKYAILIVAAKVLNGDGFIVTVYQTKLYKKKGELLWPKRNDR